MTTLTIKGYISCKPADSWDRGSPHVHDGLAFRFSPYEPSPEGGYVKVCNHSMTFEIPKGWDPRPGQIAALEAQKVSLEREFSKAVMLINRQISQLQALEYTPAEVA